MGYLLICMDIDGTLVNDEHIVPEKVVSAVKKAADRGIKTALISGRYPKGVRLAEKMLDTECIKVSYAGGYIFDKNGCQFSKTFDIELALQVYDIAKEYGGDCWFFCGEDWYVTEDNEWVDYERGAVQADPIIIDIDTLNNMCRDEHISPNKVLITGDVDTVNRIYMRLIEEELDVQLLFSLANYLEVMPLDVNKGKALEVLCELNNIAPDETIAFGDQEIDIPMIVKAGVGVAMDNGVEELKKNADFVTKSNNESGIAYALDKLLNDDK